MVYDNVKDRLPKQAPLEPEIRNPQARGVAAHDALDILQEAVGAWASISSVSVILVPRTRSNSLRMDSAMLLTWGVGRLGSSK